MRITECYKFLQRTILPAAVLTPVMAVTLAAMFAAPAQAHSPCDPTDNDRAEANRVLVGLTREIDVMEASIVEALRLQTGQLSGYAAQSAKAVTGALDAQTRLQAQIAREAAETDAMRARRPSDSACAAITGLTGLAGTRAASENAYARAAATETGRIAGDRAIVDRPGAAAGDAARFETVTGVYCNAARAGEDPTACRGGDALHGADLQPANLFDRRTFTSEAELRAAVELSRNLTAPVVNDPPPIGSADTDRERRRVLSPARRAPVPRWPAIISPTPGRCARPAPRSETGPPRSRRDRDATPAHRSAATSCWNCSPAAVSRTRTGSSACKPCPKPICCASWSPCKRSR